MSKLRLSSREIGSVMVFDLEGEPTQESLELIAWKIQKNIRRHRLQRIILNLQKIPELDYLGVRKLLAACIRPQQSLIFGASTGVRNLLESTYMPRNVRICNTETEVAEDLGPFLMDKNKDKEFASNAKDGEESPGNMIERRRSKRMHVALPLSLKIFLPEGKLISSEAIATNISEGGLFAEYLNLDACRDIEALENVLDLEVELTLHASANFPEELHLKGCIRRKELKKKQLGVAVQFAS